MLGGGSYAFFNGIGVAKGNGIVGFWLVICPREEGIIGILYFYVGGALLTDVSHSTKGVAFLGFLRVFFYGHYQPYRPTYVNFGTDVIKILDDANQLEFRI